MAGHIHIGTKISQYGWVDVEEVLDHPDNRKDTEKIPRLSPTVLELLDQEIAK